MVPRDSWGLNARTEDRAGNIAILRERGWTDDEIIQRIMLGCTYREVRARAPVLAKYFGLTEAEFVKKAGRRS